MDSDAVSAYQCSRLPRERHLFSRMVFALGMEPNLSMKVIAFWLWLEENGHRDIVRRIHSLNDGALLDVASVGKSFVETLGGLNSPPSAPGSLRFREAAIGGINFYLNGVCQKVLEDIVVDVRERADREFFAFSSCVLAAYLQRMQRSGIDSAEEHDEEARRAAARLVLDASPARRSVAEDAPSLRRSVFPAPSLAPQCDVARDERTLFVTFSNGHPLTEEELLNFFMRNYGDVEMVSIQEANDGKLPLYAHVTFRTLATLLRVLNGDVKVKFMIHGKHLWARRFIPKRKIMHS